MQEDHSLCKEVCWLVLRLRLLPLGAQSPHGVFISTDIACPLLSVDSTRQPGGDLQSFLSPYTHIHKAWVHGHACHVTPGLSTSQQLAKASAPPISDKIYLLLSPVPHHGTQDLVLPPAGHSCQPPPQGLMGRPFVGLASTGMDPAHGD